MCFATKTIRVCEDDKPWFSADLKKLDRQVKREFLKNKNSLKWETLNLDFQNKCSKEKQRYYDNIVSDLKTSNPSKWYSKVKRMAGQNVDNKGNIMVDELIGLSDQDQAEVIADHYSAISNLYDPLDYNDFSDYLSNNCTAPPKVQPRKVHSIIKTMNMKAATVKGDIPIKLISEFSVELAFPLAHIINSCLITGIYPNLWKSESVTPAPKVFPPEKLKDLRKISGLLNFSKITDKIIGELLIEDMGPSRDNAQYGNEKNVSAQHYLIKMLHRILTAVDTNSQSEAYAVIVQMIDWSQAFDRQSHKLGIESFIQNGVRPSLIPILISFFQNRKMKVKWNGQVSSERNLNGGGPQGGLLGILEYLSQTNDNVNFLAEDVKYKFIDDLSILEIINLVSQGISSYNTKLHVPSNIAEHNQYIPPSNIKSQQYLDRISSWTEDHLMKLNVDKSKYMTVNFTTNYQFSTKLFLDGADLEEVSETKLLGLILRNDLKWHSNSEFIVKKAYKRMLILHNLFKFNLPVDEMIGIYILYIRSVVENCAVVWHSSLTVGEELAIERIQRCALRIILKDDYSDYSSALDRTGLDTLKERRVKLCKNFATKTIKSGKFSDMFPLNTQAVKTRARETYQVTSAKTGRLAKSAIPYMQRLLNEN